MALIDKIPTPFYNGVGWNIYNEELVRIGEYSSQGCYGAMPMNMGRYYTESKIKIYLNLYPLKAYSKEHNTLMRLYYDWFFSEASPFSPLVKRIKADTYSGMSQEEFITSFMEKGLVISSDIFYTTNRWELMQFLIASRNVWESMRCKAENLLTIAKYWENPGLFFHFFASVVCLDSTGKVFARRNGEHNPWVTDFTKETIKSLLGINKIGYEVDPNDESVFTIYGLYKTGFKVFKAFDSEWNTNEPSIVFKTVTAQRQQYQTLWGRTVQTSGCSIKVKDLLNPELNKKIEAEYLSYVS